MGSVSVSYAISMALYFVFNKLIVFSKRGRKEFIRETLQFITLVSINYFLTLLIVTSVSRFTGEPYTGSLLAGIITIFLTWLVFKRVLFRV